MIPVIATLLPIVGKILDKVIPDKAAREAAQMEIQLKLAEQEGELVKALLQSDIAQAEINKIEAQSENPVKSLWRPVLAWGLSIITLIRLGFPYLVWGLKLFGVEAPEPPPMESSEATLLLTGLLGLGGMRSYEKKTGITR